MLMKHSVYAVVATFPTADGGSRKSRLADFDTRTEAETYAAEQTEMGIVEGATFEVMLLDRRPSQAAKETEKMSEFILQNSFVGDHGRPANQFFGGIGMHSGTPVWVNLISEAVKFPNRKRAQEWCDRCSKKVGHRYAVVPVAVAVETATIRAEQHTR